MECYIDKDRTVLEPEEIVQRLRSTLGESVSEFEVREFSQGTSGEVTGRHLWLSVEKDRLLDLVDELGKLDFPHFHVVSGDDEGDNVVLYYHLALYRAVGRGISLPVTVKVKIPKDDLTVQSLFSRIPGVEYSEREIQEMFGVDHVGLPNKGLVFLPEDWNRDVLPWRRDETAPGDDLIEELS
ncbi:MAG: NADH-quinone oxidoreductase subunit C [Synergistales bacterium]|nr:NADH-quinone oxidoreductase subunit C [Synergistales bacterium]